MSTKPGPRSSKALPVWMVLAVPCCAFLFLQPLIPGTRLGPLPAAPAREEKALETEGYTREPVSFRCSGETCAAWLYLPRQSSNPSPPLVVMGNGMGLGRTSGLHAPAEALAQAGFAVFAFDYRTYGESGGLPRQTFSTRQHTKDFHSAFAYVKSHLSERVNATNISLWGFSSGGAIVTKLAADLGHDVTAAVAVAPALITWKDIRFVASMRPLGYSKLMVALVQDTLRGWLHLPPLYVPVCGPSTSGTLLGSIPHDIQRYKALIPAEDHQVRWWNLWRPSYFIEAHNDMQAASESVAHMKVPLLLQGLKDDRWVPAFIIQRAASTGSNSVMYQEYPGDHFDMAAPGALEAQVAFLRKHAM